MTHIHRPELMKPGSAPHAQLAISVLPPALDPAGCLGYTTVRPPQGDGDGGDACQGKIVNDHAL